MIARGLILFGVLAVAASLGQPVAAAEREGAPHGSTQGQRADADDGTVWSEAVNGLQARIELKHSSVFVGTPIIATYLHLRNVSDLGAAMRLPWATARMTFRMVDAAGKEVPKRGGPFDEFRAHDVDLVLPHDGTLSFDISHHAHGVPSGQLGMLDEGEAGCWVLTKELGECSLHAAGDGRCRR